MAVYKWQFAPRFRRSAFGWRSDVPIKRIKEALTEIKLVAKKEPVLAAEGAVLFLEKVSPALENVDSSSGAIGGMVNRAIETLVPIIAKPTVEARIRQHWLERCWEALQNDAMPYIELLGDYWGELCVTADCASTWADTFLPDVVREAESSDYVHFKGSTACFSALCTAGRYDELLALLAKKRFRGWWYRHWGVRALVAQGKHDEAIRYAEDCKNIINTPTSDVARVCENILLSLGRSAEAYDRYAIAANQTSTYLSTFRAIVKKYPHKDPADILRDLVASQPGSEGKWFAAAKDAQLFDVAIELVRQSPADPKTLTRAARDYAEKQPDFAVSSGIAALHWMARGQGYDLTSSDVIEAYTAVLAASSFAGIPESDIKHHIRTVVTQASSGQNVVLSALVYKLA